MATTFLFTLQNIEGLHAIKIPKDWKQLNVHGKRKLVIAVVTNAC